MFNLQGRLSLENGGIYDGMWRYGKRSGMGSFYYSNGDVFQGSWRDDAMHGKVSVSPLCSYYQHMNVNVQTFEF